MAGTLVPLVTMPILSATDTAALLKEMVSPAMQKRFEEEKELDFSFVHKASFGIVDDPEPVPPRLEPHPAGFVMYADVPVKNPDIQKANLGIAGDRTVRHTEKTWWMPFSRKMKVTYPNGLVHIIMTLTAPIDDRRSQVIQFLLRSDSEADSPAENLVRFDRQVTHEDRAVLEHCDHDVPLGLKDELHMPTDQPGLEMRRLLARLLAEHGETEVRQDHALPNSSLGPRHSSGASSPAATGECATGVARSQP